MNQIFENLNLLSENIDNQLVEILSVNLFSKLQWELSTNISDSVVYYSECASLE